MCVGISGMTLNGVFAPSPFSVFYWRRVSFRPFLLLSYERSLFFYLCYRHLEHLKLVACGDLAQPTVEKKLNSYSDVSVI